VVQNEKLDSRFRGNDGQLPLWTLTYSLPFTLSPLPFPLSSFAFPIPISGAKKICLS